MKLCSVCCGSVRVDCEAHDPDAFVVGSGSTRVRIPFAAITATADMLKYGPNGISVVYSKTGVGRAVQEFGNQTADRFRREYAAWREKQAAKAKRDAVEAFSKMDGPKGEKYHATSLGFGYESRDGRWIDMLAYRYIVDAPADYESGLYVVRAKCDHIAETYRLTPSQFAAFAAAYLAWKSRPKPAPEPASDPDVFTPDTAPSFRFADVDRVAPATSGDGRRVILRGGGYVCLFPRASLPRFEREFAAWKARQPKPVDQPTRSGWHWYRSRPEAPWRLVNVRDSVHGKVAYCSWFATGSAPAANHRGEWRPCDDTNSCAFIQAATNPSGATTWDDPK